MSIQYTEYPIKTASGTAIVKTAIDPENPNSSPQIVDRNNSVLYQWNTTNNKFEPLGSSTDILPSNGGFGTSETYGSLLNQNSNTFIQNTTTVINKLPDNQKSLFQSTNSFQPYTTFSNRQQSQSQTQQQSTATPTNTDPTNPRFIDGNLATLSVSKDPTYELMRYPLSNYKDGTFDYLHISAVRFKESGLRTDASSFNVKSTQKRETDIYAHVHLPMQPGISDTNGVSWNEDSLNPFQAALGGVAANAIMTAGSGNAMKAAKGLVQGLINTATGIAGQQGMENYIASYFAGQAVGTNLVARTTGTVLNNNLELLFNGPKLRTFRYSYRFTPRDDKEAKMVRRIIRFFKREMSPEVIQTGLFLATPNVFKLKYISRNDNNQNPFLNHIKLCALTDMSVNYTPDGTYMTYQDGSMTSYEVELQFSELEPIYKNDYDELGDDVNDPKSMGY